MLPQLPPNLLRLRLGGRGLRIMTLLDLCALNWDPSEGYFGARGKVLERLLFGRGSSVALRSPAELNQEKLRCRRFIGLDMKVATMTSESG
jgi:hypothetical protein